MNTRFTPLFTIRIDHTYYGGTCTDFDYVLPRDTQQLVRRGKLVSRVRDGRLFVLFEADESGKPRTNLAGETLRIGVNLINPALMNFTDFGYIFGLVRPLYRNAIATDALDPLIETTPIGSRFRHEMSRAGRPVTVTLMGPAGQKISPVNAGISAENAEMYGSISSTGELTVTNDKISTVSYDLTDHLPGTYTVSETDLNAPVTKTYYFDSQLQSNAFAVLELTIRDDFYTTPPEFVVDLKSKAEPLKYFVVAKHYDETAFAKLDITDQGVGSGDREKIHFAKVAAADLGDDAKSVQTLSMDGATVALFKSTVPIVRQAEARKQLQLKENNDVLIGNLRQPSPNSANSDLIVHISKPTPT